MVLKRIFETIPAFDKRHPDPSKNYGIHGVEFRWVLKGPQGAAQFVLFTNRMLKHVQKEQLARIKLEQPNISNADVRKILSYSDEFTSGNEFEEVVDWYKFINKLELDLFRCLSLPMPADLGFHSPIPMYDGQQPIREVYKSFEFDEDNEEFTPAVYGDPVICPYLDGDLPCYYDGSGLNANRVWGKVLRSGDEETIWQELEIHYLSNIQDSAVVDE